MKTKLIILAIIGLCAAAEFKLLELNTNSKDCKKEGENCSVSRDCCIGNLCIEGICEHRCKEMGFKLQGDICLNDTECCHGYACRSGICIDRKDDLNCKKEDESCEKSTDCCISDRLLCLEGTCQHRC